MKPTSCNEEMGDTEVFCVQAPHRVLLCLTLISSDARHILYAQLYLYSSVVKTLGMTCETNFPPRQGSLSSAGEKCGSQRLTGPSQCCVSLEAKVQGSLGQCSGEGNGTPLRYSCLENPVDRGAWWAAVHGVTQSRTQLKQLGMHALEKETAPHSNVLAWRIPGTAEPGGLQSMGSHRVGHD